MIATSEVGLDGATAVDVGDVPQGKGGARGETSGEAVPEWVRGQERSEKMQGAKFGAIGQSAVWLSG